MPKKHTPNQAKNKATKERKKQGKKFMAQHNAVNDLERRSREDVNQTAARIVREATSDK